MLAEKFIIALEARLRAQEQSFATDKSTRVIGTSPHVPVKLASEGRPAISVRIDPGGLVSYTAGNH